MTELPKLATLPERLRWAFDRAGLNGSDVARATGVGKAAVSAWLTGETDNIRLPTFFAVAHLAGVDPEWLATGTASAFPEYISRESIELAADLNRLPPNVRTAVTTLVRTALARPPHRRKDKTSTQ